MRGPRRARRTQIALGVFSLFTLGVAADLLRAQSPPADAPLPSPTPVPAATPAAPGEADGTPAVPPPLDPAPPGAILTPAGVLPPPAIVAPTPPVVSGYYDQKYRRALEEVPANPANIRTRINLLDAVRVSLLRDPRIKLGTEDSLLAQGALQTAGGAFDTRLTGNARHGGEAKPRDPQAIRQQREQRKGIKDAEKAVAAQRVALANNQPVDPNGPQVSINGQSTADVQFQQQILALIAQQATMTGNTGTASAANALSQAAYDRQAQALADLDNGFIKQIKDFKLIEVDRPIDNAYDLTATKLFRNGLNTSGGLTYAQAGNRPGDPPINRSTLFLQLDIPLGRGLGTRDTGAQETSAKFDLEASLLTLRHTVSDSVLSTSLAYWQAVGARERLKLLIRNARISSALVELTRELIRGGSLDIAPADLFEIQTKEANADVQATNAELQLIQAVQSLGLSMGLDELEILDSPLPLEGFPRVISREELAMLDRNLTARAALERRADLAASIQLQKSKKTLLDAARLQLRPKVDFVFRGDLQSVDHGISANHYVSAFAGRSPGPGFMASLNLDWAPANNTQKGVVVQQGAYLRQSVVRAYDLGRMITSNVILALASLDSSLRQIDRADAEVDFARRALEAARTRFKMGQVTILDTIQVQERYVQALQDVISSRQLYAQSLVQLRFETATLLPTNRGAASLITRDDLVTLPLTLLRPPLAAASK